MKWISVKDQLPEDDAIVIAFDAEFDTVLELRYNTSYFKHKGFWLYENGGEYEYEYKEVTHWMPLPEKPK